MNYQVLARKWRPHSFDTLVGQSHIVRTLTNALQQERLHHAYLFTGTRGVGKTTLGRILATCLNCEAGISATPCQVCKACQEISTGRFIDLIEVDAASRTKVEDTRDLLDNVPYAPTQGRFKIYLIDEVHMLSTHSFNALLKTLEEPPAHVKFLLATTDPQKLPITVLSRCLQFHLKCLSPEQIAQHLAFILQEEKITYEEEALKRLAFAAQGSMRDALSLLDQAISFSGQNVTTQAIKSMLCTTEATYLYKILEALTLQEPKMLMDITHQLAEQAADFTNVLEELLSLLHQVAIAQFVSDSNAQAWDPSKIDEFAKQFTPQDIQLYYQIGLIGRKDLPLAPTPRSGFEMILLRMLAFQPSSITPNVSPITIQKKPAMPPVKTSTPLIKNNTAWQDVLRQLNLTGITALIAANCVLEQITEDEIILLLDPKQSILLNKKQEERLTQSLHEYYKRPLRVTVKVGTSDLDSPASLDKKAQEQLHADAVHSIQNDPNVQTIMKTFNAKVLEDSIKVNKD